MTFNGIITKFASREYQGKKYWDLIVGDTNADPRTRFLSEVELSRFDADAMQKEGFSEGAMVTIQIRKVAALRNGNPVVEGIIKLTKKAA